jgi:hypothetical protein
VAAPGRMLRIELTSAATTDGLTRADCVFPHQRGAAAVERPPADAPAVRRQDMTCPRHAEDLLPPASFLLFFANVNLRSIT